MAGKSTISITFKLDGDGKGFKALANDANGLKQVMAGTIVEAQKLNKSMMDWSLSVQAIGAVSNAVGQLNSTFQQITGESNQFTKAMRAANTLAGKDAAGFKALKKDVAELAKELPIARDELANGLYQVISNGVPEDNWLTFLKQTAKASIGGLADLQQAVTVTATLIKNYGLAWDEAGNIQDKIQLTAKNGVTTFEQLGEALPSVAGSAAQLGVSIDELMAVFATCTGVTGNTAEVSTQLSAVLKALIKPSTEAAKAAAAMGVQFDAAGIKAAGGLDNFLKELDKTIQQYAAQTGELSETIYGNLFGSARALRLLTSLTGEQADKFTENIGIMAGSAGTIDAAFEEMSQTGEAAAQKLKNQFAGITDAIASVGKSAAPIMAFSANVLISVNSVATLTKTLKQLNVAQALTKTGTASLTGVMRLSGLSATKAAQAVRILTMRNKSAAASAVALKIAMRGLMTVTVVGAAIAAVTAIIEAFTSRSKDAAEETKQFSAAEDAFKSKFAEVKTALDGEITELGKLIKAKADTTAAVKHLNETYGEAFGVHKTAADWYDTLTSKSKDYATQMAFEAKASSLRTQMAENDATRLANAEKMRRMAEAGEDTRQVYRTTGTSTSGAVMGGFVTEVNPEYKKLQDENDTLLAQNEQLQSELDVTTAAAKKFGDSIKDAGDAGANATNQLAISQMNLNQVKAKLEANEKAGAETTDPKKLAALKAENQQLQARKKALEAMQGLDKGGNGGRKFTKDPKTIKELSDNIAIYQDKLTGADTAEQRALQAQIAAWKKKKEAIELAQKVAGMPTEIKSLQDITDALEVLRAQRNTATKEDIAGIDARIKELQQLQATFEHADAFGVADDELKTYDQLNAKIAYYRAELETAAGEDRALIQERINDLEALKKKWDEALAALKKPADISALDTIEKLDEAISYYNALQKKAGADEVQTIQSVIAALEAKRKALQRGVDIPSMQKEIDEINALTGREYRLKIRGMGFDELTAKIRELRKMLADMDNPVTENQRRDIEAIIATYEKWRLASVDAFDTLRQGWGSIKGIGNGIQDITNALQEDGNAWQKVSAIVDGFIEIFEGIRAIIGIIDMLTTASEAHAAAKGVEATAVAAEGAAENAAATQKIGDNAAVMASNIALTGSNMAAAGSGAASSVASIPYVGPILAIAAIASVIGAILAIPKYAEGGIAYGPTLGMFGEYAGAVNNPEVVAPLDKLRTMLQPADGMGGTVVFEIEGRKLKGVLDRENNVRNRS